MSFESRRGPKKKNKTFYNLESLFFLFFFLLVLLFFCTSKVIIEYLVIMIT